MLKHRSAPASSPRILPLAAALTLALAGCGGGGGGSSGIDAPAAPVTPGAPATPPAVSTAASFPVGLAIASPGEMSSATALASAAGAQGWRTAVAWGQALWQAVREGDQRRLTRLALQATPLGSAHAAGGGTPALVAAAEVIRKVLDGDTSVSLASVLDLPALFGVAGGDAACYGPSIAYASHQDAGSGPAAGQLPSGDLGLWLSTEPATGAPCAVAQLERRVVGAKRQGLQGLVMAALMRQVVAKSSTLAMPTAGGSTDLTSTLATLLSTAMPALKATVTSATIALDAGGQYIYRLVLDNGSSGANARRGEMILRHTPGSGTGVYSGTLQVAGFTLDNDPAFGCSDQVDSATGLNKVARVSTLKYSRNGAQIDFGSRSAQYCGHPVAGTGSDDAAQVAGFTSDHQLDPAVKISGSTRGSTLGWRGNFMRYAGSFDKDSAAGSFLLAWQAGTGDDHSRAMAASAALDSATGDRTVKAYFAYAGEISASSGALQGMICNWAGPGNSHATGKTFQSQTATLASGATSFALGSSKITYAPTVSCSSGGTQFDANADGTLAAGEGVGTAANLDGLTGTSTTVDEELRSRGYTPPALF